MLQAGGELDSRWNRSSRPQWRSPGWSTFVRRGAGGAVAREVDGRHAAPAELALEHVAFPQGVGERRNRLRSRSAESGRDDCNVSPVAASGQSGSVPAVGESRTPR